MKKLFKKRRGSEVKPANEQEAPAPVIDLNDRMANPAEITGDRHLTSAVYSDKINQMVLTWSDGFSDRLAI